MASSSDPHAVRGYVPPQNEEERRLVRRAEELCQTAMARGIPRYSGFLSDREQMLALAGVNRAGCQCARFWGGWPDAERKVLCIEPPDAWQEQPVTALRIAARVESGAQRPGHRDYLGAILGLGLERTCIGDLLTAENHVVYAMVLDNKVDFLVANLVSVGRFPVETAVCDAVPETVLQGPERTLREATVPSLRADSVLAAMMHTSRAVAAQAIAGGRVEINHLPLHATHEPVYEKDLFTVRGVGRYRLQAVGGTSKKGRIFISFFQY